MLTKQGFTLTELLITLGVVAVIAGATFIFINPFQYFAIARNNQREAHINSIASAVRSRITDNRGSFENNCVSGALPINATEMGSGIGKYNIEPCLVSIYLSIMPLDPNSGTQSATGYNIIYSTTTRQFTITALNAELNKTISVTR